MGDILPGTTFTPGQLISPDILNRLVGDAEIVDGSIKSSMIASDFISALSEITDSEGEDYILIWDASEDALKKIKKTDLAGTAPVVSPDGTLVLGGAEGTDAIDLRNTTASNLINADNFAVATNGSLFLKGDEVHSIGTGGAGFRYNTASRLLQFYNQYAVLGEGLDYEFFGGQFSIASDQANKPISLGLKARRTNDASGNERYNQWFITSANDMPQLSIFPDPVNMGKTEGFDDEARVVIKGNLYVMDADGNDDPVLVGPDNSESNLFVDNIYTTDGSQIIDNGALVSGTIGEVNNKITSLTNRVTALENDQASGGNENIVVITGTIANGGIVPLPSGFSNDQCKIIVACGDALSSHGDHNRNHNIKFVIDDARQVTANGVGTAGGTANYMLIGIK